MGTADTSQKQDAKEDSGDHYMVYDYQRKIVNVVSLALDMHMPDFQEDKIACFIKTLVEKRLGPTWHVLVGRLVCARVFSHACKCVL